MSDSSEVSEFLLRVQELGKKTDLEDELRAKKLEQDILEGRRRRQALRQRMSRSVYEDEIPGSGDAGAGTELKTESSQGVSKGQPKRVISQKEAEILKTIESIAGPSGTLSVNLDKPQSRNSAKNNTSSVEENNVKERFERGRQRGAVSSSKSASASSPSSAPSSWSHNSSKLKSSESNTVENFKVGPSPRVSNTVKASPSEKFRDFASLPPSDYTKKHSFASPSTLSYSRDTAINSRYSTTETVDSDSNNMQQRSPSPSKLSRSPTRGGFIQSALLKREGTLSSGSSPKVPLERTFQTDLYKATGSLTKTPSLHDKPPASASLYRNQSSPNSDSKRSDSHGSFKNDYESSRDQVTSRQGAPSSPAEDARRWSPTKKKTWLESALTKNGEASRTSRSPSPNKSFIEAQSASASGLQPSVQNLYSSPVPSMPLKSSNNNALASSGSSFSPLASRSAGLSTEDSRSGHGSSITSKASSPSIKAKDAPFVPVKPKQTVDALERIRSLRSPSVEEPALQKNGSPFSSRKIDNKEAPDVTALLRKPLKSTPSTPTPLLKKTADTGDAEAINLLKNLRPSSPTRRQEAKDAEALEKLASLRPTSSIKKIEQDDAEALTKLKSLRSPSPVKRTKEEEAEALSKLKSLRSPSPVKRTKEEEAEALTKLKSLRSPSPVKRTKEEEAEALTKLKSLRSPSPVKRTKEEEAEALAKLKSLRSPSPVKRTKEEEAEALTKLKSLRAASPVKSPLKDNTKETLLLAKSTLKSDTTKSASTNGRPSFHGNLESLLQRGLSADSSSNSTRTSLSKTSPASTSMHKAHTIDNSELSTATTRESLSHINKGRARGPKRRLPKAAASSSMTSLSSPVTRNPPRADNIRDFRKANSSSALLESHNLNIPKKTPATATTAGVKRPPPKPRKPSSSVRKVSETEVFM